MKAKIIRKSDNGIQTIGRFQLSSGSRDLFSCYTLELPWKNNEQRKSCIPKGTYTVKKRYSTRHKNHLHITDVKGRSYILIHSGNTYKQTAGCILVGDDLEDINKDNQKDVINSRKTLDEILEWMDILNVKEFELEIV